MHFGIRAKQIFTQPLRLDQDLTQASILKQSMAFFNSVFSLFPKPKKKNKKKKKQNNLPNDIPIAMV